MNKLTILIILIIIGGFFWYQQKEPAVIEIDLPAAQEYQDFSFRQAQDLATTTLDVAQEIEVIEEEVDLGVEEKKETEEIVPPAAINLALPFTSQAPTANWEQPFQDASEEASVLMVDYYYQNKIMPDPVETENILTEMVDWQIANWGDHHNLTMQELATFVTTTFGYQTELIPDLTADKIREYLQLGQPVIVPADGHRLDNPYFSGDGPEYHMLVVKGYQDDYFITNDPGTKRGTNFVYTTENLFASIAEWNQKESRTTGPKVGLVLLPD